jgi:hypothetical protein
MKDGQSKEREWHIKAIQRESVVRGIPFLTHAHRDLGRNREHTGARKRGDKSGNSGSTRYDSRCGYHNLHNSCTWQRSFIGTDIKRAECGNITLKRGDKSGDAGNAGYDIVHRSQSKRMLISHSQMKRKMRFSITDETRNRWGHR